MASKALVLFFVVGLWASQTSTAFAPSREPRSIPKLLDFAKTKLVETLENAEDAVRSSVEVVYKNIEKLETEVLKTGTEQLYARGIKVNLTALAGIFKNNINLCVNDEKIKAEAMAIVTDIGSCVSKDSKALKTLIGDMQSLWSKAQDMPRVMEAVSKQCGEHETVDIKTDALKEFTDNSGHDLALKSNEILEHANKHLTKRDLWIVGRINRCMRAVYDLTRNDLVTIPGQILSIAANGMKIASNAQKNMQPCIAIKVGSQSAAIAKLTLEVSSCVAEGVSTGEDMEAVLAASPGLAGLKQFADVADNLNKMKGSSGLALANEALKAVSAVGTVMG